MNDLTNQEAGVMDTNAALEQYFSEDSPTATDEEDSPQDEETVSEVVEEENSTQEDAEEDPGQETDENEVETKTEESEESKEEGLTDDTPISWKLGDEEVTATLSEVKAGYMKGSDYTRKTQEVAKARQEVAELKQQLSQELEKVVGGVEAELKQYAEVDWNRLKDQDPLKYTEQRTQYLELKTQADAQKAQAQKLASEQHSAYLKELEGYVQEQAKEVQLHIPEFADEKKSAALTDGIKQYATEIIGITEQEFSEVISAKQWRVLHDAYLYNKSKSVGENKLKVVPPKITKGKSTTDSDPNLESHKGALNKQAETGTLEDTAAALLRLI